jgi:6-pyruvoyltetrahydropterin/6-carboxytetrahydropterin synthase
MEEPVSTPTTWEFKFGTHFDAAHRLLDELYKTGTRLHGHTYAVNVTLRGTSLLDHGMVVNHYTAREAILGVVGSLHDTYLNDHPDLSDVNTTPEVIAQFLWRGLREALDDHPIESMAVEVGESPTVSVTFEAPFAAREAATA